MSEIVNTATIKVVVDGTEVAPALQGVTKQVDSVETSLNKVEQAATKTGRTLESLGQGSGIRNVGDGADAAASKVDKSTKNMADAIQRATAAMDAGTKGSVEYYTALANQRGLNLGALKPYLDQLDAVTKKTELAAAAQKQFDESTKFLADLKGRTEAIGKTASELAEMRAAQLGVAESAAPMIAKMRAAENASGGLLASITPVRIAMVALAAVAAGGALFAHSISDSIDAAAGMHDLSIETGASVAALMEFKRIGETSDTTVESISGAMNKLAKGMAVSNEESKGLSQALVAIGLSFGEVQKLSPEDQMIAVAKALDKFSDGAGKSAVAMTLYGREGAKLLPFLGDLAAESDNLTTSLGEQEKASKAALAAMADNFGDNLTLIKQNGAAMRKEISFGLLPGLYEASQAFLDVTTQAGGLKDVVKALVADGSITRWARTAVDALTYVFDAAEIGKRNFVALGTIISTSLTVLSTNVSGIIDAGKNILHGDFSGAINSVTSAAKRSGSAISDLGTSLYSTYGAPTLGKQFRDRLAEIRAVGVEASKAKTSVNYDGNSDGGAAAAQKAADAAKEYDKLIGELSGLSPTFTKDWDSLSAAYARGALSLKDLTAAQAALLAKQPAIKAANDAQKKALEDEKKAYDDSRAAVEKEISSISDQASALELKVKTYGMLPDAITAAQVAELEASKQSKVLTDEGLADIQRRIDGLTRLGAAQSASQIQEDAKKASEDLDKFLDPAKAQTFGEALKTAFGSAGDSLTKLAGSLQQYGIKQAEIEKARKDADTKYKGDNKYAEYLETIGKINKKNTQEQLASYGDMAGAASGFFDESSRGYKVLNTVSQAFHAAQLAMNLASIAPAMAAGAAQFFAQSGWGGFAGVAAMGAVIAGFGIATSGGGGGPSAKDRQAANGTGSILGDSSAKSESLSKSLDLIEKNTYQDLAISTSMLAQLQQINAGINGLSNILYRTDGFSTAAPGVQTGAGEATGVAAARATAGPIVASLDRLIGGKLSVVYGKVGNALFGGNVHTVDTGISVGSGTLGQISASGATVNQYADTKTDGGLFHGDKYGTQFASLGAEINDQFTKILSGMGDAISQESAILGLSGDAFTAKLDSFVVDIGKISTKDMKPEDVQKALQNALSKVGDDMAKFAVDGLKEFQNAGEGAFETLARIATEYQTIDVVFDSFGKSFGAVGLASVSARDRVIELAGGLDKFTSQGQFFLENFFSDQEQAAALKKRIDPTLAQYGLSTEGVDASKTFRDFVVALDTTTEAGAKAYTALMTVAPAFKTVTDAAADAAKAAADAAAAAAQKVADALQAIKDAASALLGNVDSSLSVLSNVVGREKAAIQSSIDAHTASVTKLQSLSQSLKSTLDSMKSPEQQAQSRQSGQAQIQAALAIARAGGPLPSADSLKDALSAVSKDASKQFSSRTDYLRDLYQTQNDIASLGDITDDQLSTEQASLDQLKAQSNSLDAILKNAQDQIDELKGLSTIGLTINDAIHGLQVAIQSAKGNPIVSATDGITDAYQSSLGRNPDAGGLEYYQNLAAGGASIGDIKSGIANSAEAQIAKLYKDLLGRQADGAGLSYYLKSGESIAQIAADIKKSNEYKNLHPFALGTNYVPQTMPALVHEGERIIPAADNRALMARLSSPSDNSAVLAAAINGLQAENAKQREVMEEMAKDMSVMADKLKEVAPGGFIRTKAA